MKLRLTIDTQPIVLELNALLALFGRQRMMEFAEGRWTPFVFCELAEPIPAAVAPMPVLNVSALSEEELSRLLNALPQQTIDFPGLIRNEIAKVEALTSDSNGAAEPK